MSGQMLKRVNLWEQQSTTNLNPPTASPVPSPSPQTSTPDHSRGEGGGGGGEGEAKRFPFVSKTVLQVRVHFAPVVQ